MCTATAAAEHAERSGTSSRARKTRRSADAERQPNNKTKNAPPKKGTKPCTTACPRAQAHTQEERARNIPNMPPVPPQTTGAATPRLRKRTRPLNAVRARRAWPHARSTPSPADGQTRNPKNTCDLRATPERQHKQHVKRKGCFVNRGGLPKHATFLQTRKPVL